MTTPAADTRLAPLDDVLDVAAAQLDDLAALCCRLQDALGPFLIHGAPQDAQTLDLITQRLAGLAMFLSGLASRLPPDIRVNAAAAARPLPLSDLANLLALEPPTSSQASAGDLDLFG